MYLHIMLPILLVSAKFLGELARRLHMPAIVGEIGAGVLLGPAWLGVIHTADAHAVKYGMLEELGQIGLCTLLFRIGMDTKFRDFRPVWRPILRIAGIGVIAPFVLGGGMAMAWGYTPLTAAFVGATLATTSVGISMAVLDEVRATASREGRLIIGAGVMDDVLGLILLSGLVALVSSGGMVGWAVTKSFAVAVLFILAAGVLGAPLAYVAVTLSDRFRSKGALIVIAFAFFLVSALIAEAIGLAMIIGAYAAGLAFGQHREQEQLREAFEPLIDLLTPLFFVLIGSAVAVSGLNPIQPAGRAALGLVALLLAAAILGKLVCGAVVARGTVSPRIIGWGMVPRGEVGFVFLNVALSAGVMSADLFSALAVVLIGTSILGPIMLRVVWRRMHPSPERAAGGVSCH